MITLLKSSQRHHVQRGQQEVWHSFFAKEGAEAPAVGFGFLLTFDELRIPPDDATDSHFDDGAEVIFYLYKGALSRQDTAGHSGVICTGEFHHISTGQHIRHQETSVSRPGWVRAFRFSLLPSEKGIAWAHEQMRFTTAQRRNALCVVASPDGRKGSLHIHQDVLVYSAILEPGHHLVHALAPDRTAWIHIVCGQATLRDLVLTEGDGVGITDEPSVSLTVQQSTEMLLVDLGLSRNNFPEMKTRTMKLEEANCEGFV